MTPFFSYVRRNRDSILDSYGNAHRFCSALSADILCSRLPDDIQRLLVDADTDSLHYAISSAYALLIDPERRKDLSAYFTPPILARAAIEASASFLDETPDPAVLDPACGGGSFLTPVARYLVAK